MNPKSKLLIAAVVVAAAYCSAKAMAQETPQTPEPGVTLGGACPMNETWVDGRTSKGIYIAWWCGRYEYRFYAATWDWMTYANKQKLIPLVKVDTSWETVEAFMKANAKIPITDPRMQAILNEARGEIYKTRPPLAPPPAIN